LFGWLFIPKYAVKGLVGTIKYGKGVSDGVKVRYGFWDAEDFMFCVLKGIINLSFLHRCFFYFLIITSTISQLFLTLLLSSHPSISFIVPDECCHTRPI